jgi:hypothetical protein
MLVGCARPTEIIEPMKIPLKPASILRQYARFEERKTYTQALPMQFMSNPVLFTCSIWQNGRHDVRHLGIRAVIGRKSSAKINVRMPALRVAK